MLAFYVVILFRGDFPAAYLNKCDSKSRKTKSLEMSEIKWEDSQTRWAAHTGERPPQARVTGKRTRTRIDIHKAHEPDPNPATHTFLIPHNWFQSKGSCLSGPRRGLIAWYKILKREGKAAGEREGARERVMGLYSFSSLSLSFPPFMLYLCRNLVSVKMVEKKKQTLCEVNPTDSGGKHLS